MAKKEKKEAAEEEAALPRGWTADLQTKYEEIREKLREHGGTDATVRYEVGQIVKEIAKDEKKYGKFGVGRLAKGLGFQPKTLYAYGRVATIWPKPQFESLMKKEIAETGLRLSFSHLEEIARVEDAERRKELVDQVLREGLGARAVAKVIRGAKPKRKVLDPKRLVRSVQTSARRWSESVEAWSAALAALQTSKAELAFEDHQVLADAIVAHKNVNARMVTLIAGLEGLPHAEPRTEAASTSANGKAKSGKKSSKASKSKAKAAASAAA